MESIRKEQTAPSLKKTHSPLNIHLFDARRKMTPHTFRVSSQPTPIDRDCIRIINRKSPNKIFNLMKNKGLSNNQRSFTVSKERIFFKAKLKECKTKIFQDSYERQHFRFIRLTEKQFTTREQLKSKLGLLKEPQQEEDHIDIGRITYFEKTFKDTDSSLGRYKQKMHPLCRIYEKQADRYLYYRLRLGNGSKEL